MVPDRRNPGRCNEHDTDIRATLDWLWSSAWLESVGPADLAAMKEDKARARSYLVHESAGHRFVALQVLATRWGNDAEFVEICKRAARHDANARVRRVAVNSLAAHFAGLMDVEIQHLLAEIVCDLAEAIEVRQEAYEGLFRISGASLLAALLDARAAVTPDASSSEQRVAALIVSVQLLSSTDRHRCPVCGAEMARIIHISPARLCAKEQAMIAAGLAVVGPDSQKCRADAACLACFPEWREFNRLAIRNYACQLAKEDALAMRNLPAALSMRDRQKQLRPLLDAASERLSSS